MKLCKALYLCLLITLSGCATVPYRYGVDYIDPRLPPTPLSPEEQIVRGRPNRFLDASDWIWPGSLLGKLVLWDRRVDNHKISEETEEVMRRYLEDNQLGHVKVVLNGYQVGAEWLRLVNNRSIAPGWRYTLGFLSWLQYTIMPGRFFGGDHYNPYTNTIHLYSDIPAIAVHEGGHAKDFANRKWKGTYAAIYGIPFVNLYHEAIASSDALGYLRAEESRNLQYEGYRLMHPAYGTYLGSNFSWLFPAYEIPITLGTIGGGHITGRIRGRQVSRQAHE